MPENWKTYKLKELTSKIGSGATPRGGKEAYKESGISLIRSQNVLDFSFSSNGLAFIDEGQAAALNNVTLESQDVLLNITGDSVARVCKVPDHWLPARVNQHVAIVRANEKILNPDFLHYSLLSRENKNLLLTMAGAGATRNALTKTMIEEFEISVPGIQEQKSIASILSALDDKIELNLQMNKTLEEMAMALYKHWFVDFGPFQDGEFVGSELGEIPKGWEVKKIEETSFEIGDGNYSSKYPTSKEFIETGIPFIRAVNMVNGSLISNDLRYISLEKHKTITKGHLKKGDVLIVTRGSIGEVARVPNYFIGANINAQLVRINGKDEVPSSYLYQTFKAPKNNNRIVANKSGTALQQLPVGALKSIPLLIPPKKLLHSFEERTGVMYVTIDNNNEENQTLTQLRDTLLPKLISGEVRVKDVEKTLTEVL
ncbi:restriction endonuclease subunit S [Salinimicrobium sp. WS361]|uniref:restriction endonuclease subunit S n=1 Tax=Salinimicrobium sp. WS361 TaxID=3425123 RepID=UPI003D6EFE18